MEAVVWWWRRAHLREAWQTHLQPLPTFSQCHLSWNFLLVLTRVVPWVYVQMVCLQVAWPRMPVGAVVGEAVGLADFLGACSARTATADPSFKLAGDLRSCSTKSKGLALIHAATWL